MKEIKNKEPSMIKPQIALQQYLDDLLQEATSEPILEEHDIEPDQEVAVAQEPNDFEAKTLEPDTVESEVSESEDNEQVELQEKTPSDETFNEQELQSLDASFKNFENAITELNIQPEPEPEPAKISRVAKTDPLPWATGRFECLLFYVGGLKMAVPLVELGGIFQSGADKLTSIFGQPDWFMGVANVGEFNLRTVDTALWVMPNHYKGSMRDNFKFVIQLDRSDWSVACEQVAEAITLEPSQVKWRTDRSKRPWLAGTVIDHMCAILDVQGFIEILEDPSNGFKQPLKK